MPILARHTFASQDVRRLLDSEDPATKIKQINHRHGWNISPGAREIISNLNPPEDDFGEVILFLQSEGGQGRNQIDLFQLRVGAERGTTPAWFGLALFLEQTFVQGIMVDQDLRDESVEILSEGAVVYRLIIDHPARVTSRGNSTLMISYWPEIIREEEGEMEVFQQACWELSVCYDPAFSPVKVVAFADLSASFFGRSPLEVGIKNPQHLRA